MIHTDHRRIVIIDDDPDFANSLALIFKGKNFITEKIIDPLKGMEAIKSKKTDLVLLDVKMEKLSGMEVLKMIKQYNRSIPVILLSAYKIPDEAFKLGAELCLNKPLPPKDLIQMVVNIVEKKVKFSQCMVCRKLIKLNEGRYFMPEGICCQDCRDKLPDC